MAFEPTREGAGIGVGDGLRTSDEAGSLLDKSQRCRRLAAGVSDKQTSDVLTQMAADYESAASRLTREG